MVLGFFVAGIFAYLAIRFLMRYFQTRTLTPFAAYCVAVGAAGFLFACAPDRWR